MNKPTPGFFGKTTQSLLTGSMLMGAILLPSSAKGQGTLETINFGGTVNQIWGTPGISDGGTVPGSITFNPNNLVLVGGTGLTKASGYTVEGDVTINGSLSSVTLQIDVFHGAPDINNVSSDGFGLAWGPDDNDGVGNYFPTSVAPDTTVGSLQTMLNLNPSEGLSGDNQFDVYANTAQTSLAQGNFTSFSVQSVPEPSTLAFGLLAAGGWLVKRRNSLRRGIPGQDIGVSTK